MLSPIRRQCGSKHSSAAAFDNLLVRPRLAILYNHVLEQLCEIYGFWIIFVLVVRRRPP